MFIRTWRSIALIAGEAILLMTAVAVGSYARIGDETWSMLSSAEGLSRVLLIVVVCQVCLHYADLYDLRAIGDMRDLLVRLLQALGATSLILAVVYFWFPDWIIGRGVFLIASALVISFVVTWRVAFAWLTRHVGPRERLLLVGTSPAAIELARELFERRQALGVEIVGFIDPDPARIGAAVINPGVIGTIDDIPLLVSRLNVDRVVVSLADARGRLPMDRAARHPSAKRRHLRPPGLGLRGVHGQDRAREPAAELADLLGGISQDTPAPGREADPRSHDGARGAHHGRPADAPGRGTRQARIARSGVLSPGAGGPGRPRVHRPQVPHDAAGCRSEHRSHVEPAQ